MASWLQYSALTITYSLLAAAILEAILRLWRVQDARIAVAFRLPILAIPPLAPMLFLFLDSILRSEQFRRQEALLELRRWMGPEPDLSQPGWVLLIAITVTTTLLVVALEGTGYLRESLSRPVDDQASLPPPALQEVLTRLSARGIHQLHVLLSNQPQPVACTMGLRHPTILISSGLLGTLDAEELESVLAHEVAHARRRDNRLGWLLFTLRLVSFYNPVAQLAFHQIEHDTERICDAEAGQLTGKPAALASALLKVYMATRVSNRSGFGWKQWAGKRAIALENRARLALIEDRIERLIHPEAAAQLSFPQLRLSLAVVAVVGLAYLVV